MPQYIYLTVLGLSRLSIHGEACACLPSRPSVLPLCKLRRSSPRTTGCLALSGSYSYSLNTAGPQLYAPQFSAPQSCNILFELLDACQTLRLSLRVDGGHTQFV